MYTLRLQPSADFWCHIRQITHAHEIHRGNSLDTVDLSGIWITNWNTVEHYSLYAFLSHYQEMYKLKQFFVIYSLKKFVDLHIFLWNSYAYTCGNSSFAILNNNCHCLKLQRLVHAAASSCNYVTSKSIQFP